MEDLFLPLAMGVVSWCVATSRVRRHAVCRLGDLGSVVLHAEGRHFTRVVCDLRGIAPGLHGLHVHDGCGAACGHYNPTGASHGGPVGSKRHRGDLGNVAAGVDGRCTTEVVAEVRLAEILGRALVLHADPDDLGVGGAEDSATTGHAGPRIACGRIVPSE